MKINANLPQREVLLFSKRPAVTMNSRLIVGTLFPAQMPLMKSQGKNGSSPPALQSYSREEQLQNSSTEKLNLLPPELKFDQTETYWLCVGTYYLGQLDWKQCTLLFLIL